MRKKTQLDGHPCVLSGDQVWQFGHDFPKVIDGPFDTLSGYEQLHNWTKKSIFWNLPFWKDNLLRHNLDIMHIINNFFDNVFNAVINVKGKVKDNEK